MKNILKSALLAIALLMLIPHGYAQKNALKKVQVYFFWGDGCPHCEHEKPFLEELQKKYPQVEVKSFETWYNRDNAKLYADLAQAYGRKSSGVPATFAGDKMWIGYRDETGRQIERKVQECLNAGACADPLARLKAPPAQSEITDFPETVSPGHPVCVHVFLLEECYQCNNVLSFFKFLQNKHNIELKLHDISSDREKVLYEKFKEIYGLKQASLPAVFIGERVLIGENSIAEFLESQIERCAEEGCLCPTARVQGALPVMPWIDEATPDDSSEISLPFFGKVDTSAFSLPLLTIILGGLDGFNPCAFFVLFMLLSMLVHARSRGKMLLIGGVFVFFSAFIYFIFMAAWLNLFLLLGQLRIITLIAGAIAVVFALINIKEFFYFGRGVSLTIPQSAKPKLFERMRGLLKSTSTLAVLTGTVVLAILANTYELLCTAGFPMVFTRALTLHSLPVAQYYAYLVLYNLVYVIPLAIIVLIFAVTLGGRKLTERQGQILKLISGMMMLGLGGSLLIRPSLLNNVIYSVGLLSGSLIIAFVMVYISDFFRTART